MEEYILEPFSESFYWDTIPKETMDGWEKIDTSCNNNSVWLYLEDEEPIVHLSFFLLNQKLHLFADYRPTKCGKGRRIYGEVLVNLTSGNSAIQESIGEKVFSKLVSAQSKNHSQSVCICNALDNQGNNYQLYAYLIAPKLEERGKMAVCVDAAISGSFSPSLNMVSEGSSVFLMGDKPRDNTPPTERENMLVCDLENGERFLNGDRSELLTIILMLFSISDNLQDIEDLEDDIEQDIEDTEDDERPDIVKNVVRQIKSLGEEDTKVLGELDKLPNNMSAGIMLDYYKAYNRRIFYIVRTTASVFAVATSYGPKHVSGSVRLSLTEKLMSILAESHSSIFYILPTKIRYADGREIVEPVRYNPTISQLIGMEDKMSTSDGRTTVDAPGLCDFISSFWNTKTQKSAKSSCS